MDEISNISETTTASLEDGEVSTYMIEPEDFGSVRTKISGIAGGTPEENARDIVRIFKGEEDAKRDIVVLNAGAAILVGGKVDDLESMLTINSPKCFVFMLSLPPWFVFYLSPGAQPKP